MSSSAVPLTARCRWKQLEKDRCNIKKSRDHFDFAQSMFQALLFTSPPRIPLIPSTQAWRSVLSSALSSPHFSACTLYHPALPRSVLTFLCAAGARGAHVCALCRQHRTRHDKSHRAFHFAKSSAGGDFRARATFARESHLGARFDKSPGGPGDARLRLCCLSYPASPSFIYPLFVPFGFFPLFLGRLEHETRAAALLSSRPPRASLRMFDGDALGIFEELPRRRRRCCCWYEASRFFDLFLSFSFISSFSVLPSCLPAPWPRLVCLIWLWSYLLIAPGISLGFDRQSKLKLLRNEAIGILFRRGRSPSLPFIFRF